MALLGLPMNFSKEIDLLFHENKFQKNKVKNYIQYSSLLADDVELLFTYSEEKSKYSSGPNHLLFECGIRFSKVEDFLQLNNQEFLMSMGWKMESFNFRKYASLIKDLYNNDIDKNKLSDVYESLKTYLSYSFSKDYLNGLKMNIKNLEVPGMFSDSRPENMILRALIFEYLDGNLNDIFFEKWISNFPIANNDAVREGLVRLKTWLINSK